MNRLTEKHWRNLDPWECCGQNHYCTRGCHDLGGCTGGCIVPKIYSRLATYEDTGLEPQEIVDLCDTWNMYGGEEGITAALTPPINNPLTLDELREMDGQPVWLENLAKKTGMKTGWVIVNRDWSCCRGGGNGFAFFRDYGETWTAYHHKPEVQS